jgi:hypothetical protein
MNDRKLIKWLLLVLFIPIGMSMCSGDRFRYPCQNPDNWDKDFCKMPLCDVTRTCPEHIFKGQNDPRKGPVEVKPVTPAPTGVCK